MRGNFARSWGVAGALSCSSADVPSGPEFTPAAGLSLVAPLGEGVAPGPVPAVFETGSVTIIPPSCAVFHFHQNPPPKAATLTRQISRIRVRGLCRGFSGSCPKLRTGSVAVPAETCGSNSGGSNLGDSNLRRFAAFGAGATGIAGAGTGFA